ncbi:MAG: Dph6-related ATP pyrophosphatase [Bacteriovorax sp.]
MTEINETPKEKILMFWSGGKDSALTLHYLKKDPKFEVVGLITTFDRDSNTVKYHGIPDSLIVDQAKMLKLPLQRIFLPGDCSNEEYMDHVGKILAIFGRRGIRHIAFGDIHLKDVRKFREDMLLPLEMKALFPLWGKDSNEISKEFFKTGHKALVTSIMKDKLDKSFLNCEYDQEFVDRLPKNIDPAGENGEFHTFVTYSPHFKMRVPFSKAIAVEEGPYLVSLMKEP